MPEGRTEHMPKGRKRGKGVRPLTRVRSGRLEERQRKERLTILKWLAVIIVFLMVASAFFVIKT